MKRLFAFIFLLSMAGCQSGGKKLQPDSLREIDVSRQYPEIEIHLQNAATIEYVPLETTDDVLLSASAILSYVSDKYVVVWQRAQNDIFVFDRSGKIVSHFNHKGPSNTEYNAITSLVFDEKNGEIFVFDIAPAHRALVYSITGEYKRTLSYPEDLQITGYHFDDESLLVYDEKGLRQQAYSKTPYLLISKQDGSVVSTLDIQTPVRYSNMTVKEVEMADGRKAMSPLMIATLNNRHFGQDYMIADFSSDTVYRLTPDRDLSPVIVRKPSVHASEPRKIWGIHLSTDHFILLSVITLDFAAIERKQGIPNMDLIYDFKTGETNEVTLINDDYPSKPLFLYNEVDIPQKNTVAAMMPVFDLKSAAEEKQLKGELEQLVATLDDEDNPIVMIVKFK
ncbi:MAG: 6-bladed beta-propeller [Tannerella sp.]|jgi:hypothetical protein|nr:6-bladed beta-propeller [Tannerella sp.]